MLSVEWLLKASILVFGVGTGMYSVQQAINYQFNNAAESIRSLPLTVDYSGYGIGPAQVGGVRTKPGPTKTYIFNNPEPKFVTLGDPTF